MELFGNGRGLLGDLPDARVRVGHDLRVDWAGFELMSRKGETME